jgi:hypothetical protein
VYCDCRLNLCFGFWNKCLSVVGQSDEVIKTETFGCCGWIKVDGFLSHTRFQREGSFPWCRQGRFLGSNFFKKFVIF